MRKIIFAFLFLLPGVTLATTYGSNFFTGGVYSESSHLSSSDGSLAFDGNLATYWLSANSEPQWLGYDLGTSTTKFLDKIYFYVPTGAGCYIKNISVTGSNDNFVSSSTLYDYLHPNSDTDITITSTQSIAYRYWKINFLDNYCANGNAAYEIEGFEDLDAHIASSTIGNMEPGNLVLIYLRFLFDALIVCGVAYGIYKFIKR